MPRFSIHVAEHERYEAIEAYGDWLTENQKDQLREGEHNWTIICEGDFRTTIATLVKVA